MTIDRNQTCRHTQTDRCWEKVKVLTERLLQNCRTEIQQIIIHRVAPLHDHLSGRLISSERTGALRETNVGHTLLWETFCPYLFC